VARDMCAGGEPCVCVCARARVCLCVYALRVCAGVFVSAGVCVRGGRW
jgi:hypothetical protein